MKVKFGEAYEQVDWLPLFMVYSHQHGTGGPNRWHLHACFQFLKWYAEIAFGSEYDEL